MLFSLFVEHEAKPRCPPGPTDVFHHVPRPSLCFWNIFFLRFMERVGILPLEKVINLFPGNFKLPIFLSNAVQLVHAAQTAFAIYVVIERL